MMNNINRKAFTMLELIFVIVIMGIIGKFGVEFIAQAYKSFIFSKINNELQSNSASAIEFIAKRLEYRIKNSTITRNLGAGTWTFLVSSADENATVLEWIGADIDGFRATTTPNWSGVIDLNASNGTTLVSPATITANTNALINTLSYTNSGIANAAVYFMNQSYMIGTWGYNGNLADQNDTIHPITSSGANVAWFLPDTGANNFTGIDVFEYYKLAWSAYAVVLEDYNTTTNIGNLVFYYDYQPWEGESYINGKSAVIMENINSFRFRPVGSLLKIQVCAKSDLTNEEYAICKEKTIY